MWIAWKQDKTKILQMNILKKGKKQDISNWNLANQEGNKNIKMYEIENLAWILLRSDQQTFDTVIIWVILVRTAN